MIKDFSPRLYQQTIFDTAAKRNCLVVLPTGLGKTAIAFMLAAHRLSNYPKSKILVLAPTRPLAEQHLKTFRKHMELDEKSTVLFTGFVRPEKRVILWNAAKIIITTPQGLENDIISGKMSFADVSLLVFDEAHRAVKDYSYVFLAKQYQAKAKYPRILGLTASPGSSTEEIQEVCANLFIEDIEIRTEEDVDVKDYVQDVDIKWFEVDFPEKFREIKIILERFMRKKTDETRQLGHFQGSLSNYTRTALLGLQAELRSKVSSGERDFSILKSISLLAEVMKMQHGLELLESQGLESLKKYFDKLKHQAESTPVKAVKNLVSDLDFKLADQKVKDLLLAGINHPKLEVLKNTIIEETSKNKDAKIIIFTQYRSSSSTIKNLLEDLSIKSKIFIGQSTKEEKGLSQKEQKQIIEDFSLGNFNCLISTSVGEEGLDIPQVDLVIFYEPIPSAIRSIQRRGRTGRLDKGKVFILMTKKTRDEAYRWSSHRKEGNMYKNLRKLKDNFKKMYISPDKNLSSFVSQDNLSIIVDYREKTSAVVKILSEEGVKIDLRSLETGDYVISNEVVIEYKTKKDFVDSIIDGRLLQQARSLSRYLKPMIILEGEEDIYSQRNIHPNAIRGMIATISLSYHIPILFTKSPQDTASFLKVIAKREQDTEKREFQMHTQKPLSLKEQQEYIVSALPGIGAALAKPLLKKFKSVKKLVNADQELLKKVELIGEKKAKRIREVLDSDYSE